MNYEKTLHKIGQKTNESRRNVLKAELDGFPCSDYDGMALILPAKNSEITVVMAHFDSVPGSLGYNDNGMSLVALLSILHKLPPHVEVVFSNGEERGFLGAQYYLKKTNKKIQQCINLDVCGYGDQLYLDPMNTPLFPEQKKDCKTGQMPLNDAAVFEEQGIPSLTISAGPENTTFQQGIFMIEKTIHNGPLDNRMDILNFGLIDKVGEKIQELVKQDLK